MNADFYKAFEDRFRGSRESIKERLKVYLPLIEPLTQLSPEPVALDLGCGRGEWLELLEENGFGAVGVDQDPQMLQSARDRGLRVYQDDAIDYLKTSPEDAAVLISGFHIAEHLPFEVLMELVTQSLRVLRPGGLLILETPNPENIAVGSNTFYTDPTHERPLPPSLLSFLPEYAGFGRTTIFRLNEPPLSPDAPVSLFDVITGASPDYAIIAQKTADPAVLERFDREFFTPRGLSMDALALRNSERFERGESEISRLSNRLEEQEGQIREMNHRFHTLEERLTLVHTHLDAVNARFEWEIEKIHGSYSWKITAPLRWMGRLLRRFGAKRPSLALNGGGALSAAMGTMLRRLIAFSRTNPIARTIALWIAHRFPSLAIRLKKRLYDSALPPKIEGQPRLLSPRSIRIYQDLKHAISQKTKGGR